MRHADIALYRAKSQGRGTIQFFLPSMQVTVDERLQVERGLRQALDRGDLLLQFQPQLNRAAQVVGAEALLRWRQPGKGVAGPADFIPVAEETGLIHSIGQWALAETCDRLKAWESAVLTGNLVVSVNVSSWQFVRDDFVRQVERQLARSGAHPARLVLEITESALFYDIEDAMQKMHALCALGLRLSMDDFGTGFSSLNYLRKLPLNELKIDQSFRARHRPGVAGRFSEFHRRHRPRPGHDRGRGGRGNRGPMECTGGHGLRRLSRLLVVQTTCGRSVRGMGRCSTGQISRQQSVSNGSGAHGAHKKRPAPTVPGVGGREGLRFLRGGGGLVWGSGIGGIG